MDIRGTPFFEINIYNIIVCLAQLTIKYELFKNYFSFTLKKQQALGYYLTNYAVLYSLNLGTHY